MFAPLPNKKYAIIYADPPWEYEQVQHGSKGDIYSAEDHYPTVCVADLKKLDVNSIAADDCLLFMWTCGPQLDVAIELGIAWGFAYKTIAFVWDKVQLNPGYYTMSQTEPCLVFKKGRIPQPRGGLNERQLLTETRTVHSRKPVEIRDRIDRMFPEQSKIELFAREKYEGWDVWGNEAPVEIERNSLFLED